jgi:hypothetical protein
VLHDTEKRKKLIIFITGLQNKLQGWGSSVASTAEPFTTKTEEDYIDVQPVKQERIAWNIISSQKSRYLEVILILKIRIMLTQWLSQDAKVRTLPLRCYLYVFVHPGHNQNIRSVALLRRLVASLSLRKLRCKIRPVDVRCGIGSGFSPSTWFSPVSIIPSVFHIQSLLYPSTWRPILICI